MTSAAPRFDALDNFRDYGGYAVPGGKIRTGRLYRSAHLARLTPSDLATLANLDIGTVIDLRRPVEREKQPSRRPDGFDATVIASDLDAVGEAPHITFLKTADLTPESGRRFMTETYGRLPYAPAHVELFARYFQVLARSDRPVLIHCAAGKDRTGILVALTHHVLGVGREDMIQDYLLTNVAVDLEARAPAIAAQLKVMTGRDASHDAVVAFMGVEAAYLETALTAIATRSGSVDAYLDAVLGVDAAMRDRMVERLVV